MELAAAGCALVIVDMQNGFCDARGSVARIGLDTAMCTAAVAPCARLIAAARRAHVPVFHTVNVYAAGHTDGGVLIAHLMPELRTHNALLADSWDAAIVAALEPVAGEVVITKNRPSAFFRTALEAALADRGITRLVVAGVTTNCCVESTERDASQLDFETFVVADATGELDRARHAAALATMGMLFACVVSVAEVEAAFGC